MLIAGHSSFTEVADSCAAAESMPNQAPSLSTILSTSRICSAQFIDQCSFYTGKYFSSVFITAHLMHKENLSLSY